MSKNRHPIFGGAIFCNSASKGDSGKVNCQGIFTSFLAWAYPTSLRSWNAIFTIHNLPEGDAAVTASISRGRGKKTTLASGDIEKTKEDLGNVIVFPLRCKFTHEGSYTVRFAIVGTTTVHSVPVKVITQKWPQFTQKQLKILKNNPSIPHSVRMNINCSDCSRVYVFEESVLPGDTLADGVLPFPESGVFECEGCGHMMSLKDIQGQLRSSIKTAVLGAIRRGD